MKIEPRIKLNYNIYDFVFSQVGKIWDGRETAKSQIVWDFPDIRKPYEKQALFELARNAPPR